MSRQIRFPLSAGLPAVSGMGTGEGGRDHSPWVAEIHCSAVTSSVPAGLDPGPCQGPRGVSLCSSEGWGLALARRTSGRWGLQHGFSWGGSVIPSWPRKATRAGLQVLCFPGRSRQKSVDQAQGELDGGVRRGHGFPAALGEAFSSTEQQEYLCLEKLLRGTSVVFLAP